VQIRSQTNFLPAVANFSKTSVDTRALMKKLRKIFGKNGWLSSNNGKAHPERHNSRSGKRTLHSEALEKRNLMAADVALNHNYLNQFDVNNDGQVTPVDALVVMNTVRRQAVGRGGESVAEMTVSGNQRFFPDVDNDGDIVPLDALTVINALRRGAGETDTVPDLVELIVTARDNNDVELAKTGGIYNVNVDQPFNLEVSYNDLRTEEIEGLFSIITDLTISGPNGGLTPLLVETQQFIFDVATADRSKVSEIRFSQEGTTTTFSTPFAAFAASNTTKRTEINKAMAAFGYDDPTAYQITFTAALDDGGAERRLGATEIRFIGDEFRNVDLPDLKVDLILVDNTFDPNLAVRNISPIENGAPNPDAVPFSMSFVSRTFDDEVAYEDLGDTGSFNPAVGFINVGGVSDPGGILNTDGEVLLPFDAFSIPVKFSTAANDTRVTVRPAAGVSQALVLHGLNEQFAGRPLLMTEVLMDDDAVARFNVAGASSGLTMTNATRTVAEDAANQVIDLTTLVTQGTATSFTIVTPPAGTIATASITGNNLTIDLVEDAFTPAATPATIVIRGNGAGNATATSTITLSVTPVNDPPEAGDDTLTPAVTTGATRVITFAELRSNDNTGAANETDTLTITVTAGATTRGGSISAITATGFTYTAPATAGNDTFNYTLSDGTATDTGTVTISVTGASGGFTMTNATRTVAEDAAAQTIDLTTLVSQGTATGFTIVTPPTASIATASITGNTLTFTPVKDAFTTTPTTIVVEGTSNATPATTARSTITLNVTPVNDAPVAGDDTLTPAVTTGATRVITFAELRANDNTGAANETDTLTITVTAGATTRGGSISAITATGFTYTAPATAGNDTFNYTLSDGTATDTATVTINVTSTALAAPIAGDRAATIDQGDVFTVDLRTLNTGGLAASFAVVAPLIPAANGTAVVNGNTLTITPSATFTGNLVVNYSATNATGSDNGQITLAVTPVGANRPPVSPGPLQPAAISEQDAASTINLLLGVTDADNDTLSTRNIVLRGTNTSGVTINASANTVTVNPNAYNSLTAGQTIEVNVDYEITDGQATITRTARIVVNGFNDAPVAVNDSASGFTGVPLTITVLGNDNTGGETQTLTVTQATSPNGTVVRNANGTLTFTSAAGFVGNTTINYTISDGDKTASAVVNVSIANFSVSRIRGAVFQDNITNLQAYLKGAAPIYNGLHDSGETTFAGVPVRLRSGAGENVTGQPINLIVLSDVNGEYEFTGVAPGTYQVIVELPSSIITTSPTSSVVIIGPAGGQNLSGPSVSRAEFSSEFTGGTLLNDDILSSSHRRTLGQAGNDGGLVALNEDGSQSVMSSISGFEDAAFVEIALSQDRDQALLTVLEEDGDLKTALLSSDQFVLSSDGRAVRFFGGLDNLTFISDNDDDLQQDFPSYRRLIDQILGSN
jgi:Bacterial Ig domain/Dockerin type I domain/SdrD B-like domain